MRACFIFPFFCLILVELARHRKQQEGITSPLRESTPRAPNLSFRKHRILAIPSNSNSFQLVPATELTIVLFSAEQSRVSFFLRVLSTKYHVHNPFQLNAIRPTTRIRLNEHRIDVIYREILDKTLCIYIYVCAYVCDSWL